MIEREDEKELLQQAVAGNSEAYRVLVDRYEERLISMVSAIVGSQADAEDVVQEVFVKAFFNLSSFRGGSQFYSWIYRIAYHMAIDLKRKIHRLKEVSGDEIGGASTNLGDDPSERIQLQQQQELLQKAIASLSEEHRAVVMLREVEGLSYGEIAHITSTSKGTVMSRLHYARKALKAYLKESEETTSAPNSATRGKQIVVNGNGEPILENGSINMRYTYDQIN